MGKQVSQGKSIDRETDPDVIARRTALFNEYVMPYTRMIFKLCVKYSSRPDHVDENYADVMTNFYRRIETYDPERSILTWLHICVKRQVWASEKSRQRHDNKSDDEDIDELLKDVEEDTHISSNVMGVDNWRSLYSHDIVTLLDELPPLHRDALILQEAGYTLKEITEIEYARGALKSLNMNTIKSRIKLARQYLKKNLTRYGKRLSCQANT